MGTGQGWGILFSTMSYRAAPVEASWQLRGNEARDATL